MIGCIGKMIASRYTRRNQLTPVNKLPQDVVNVIFKNILPPSLEYYDELGNLRLVCKAWKRHIDTSRQYWVRVHSRLTKRFLKTVLKRAGGIPMVVEYHPTSKTKE